MKWAHQNTHASKRAAINISGKLAAAVSRTTGRICDSHSTLPPFTWEWMVYSWRLILCVCVRWPRGIHTHKHCCLWMGLSVSLFLIFMGDKDAVSYGRTEGRDLSQFFFYSAFFPITHLCLSFPSPFFYILDKLIKRKI